MAYKKAQIPEPSPRNPCLSSHPPLQSSLAGLFMVDQTYQLSSHRALGVGLAASVCSELSFPLAFLIHTDPAGEAHQCASVCPQSSAQESLGLHTSAVPIPQSFVFCNPSGHPSGTRPGSLRCGNQGKSSRTQSQSPPLSNRDLLSSSPRRLVRALLLLPSLVKLHLCT